MAAPPELTLRDLTGDWVMNKTLSDDTDPLLALQGIGWWTRKAIGLATITLHTKQYTGDNGTTHIDIDQTATGGLKGTSEYRELDWIARAHEDHLFGNVKARSRWLNLDVDLDRIEDSFLKDGWLENDEERAGPSDEYHIQSMAVNEEKGWTANQIWGFAIIDGQRYYTRRVIVTKGDQAIKVRLVYNWQGKK